MADRGPGARIERFVDAVWEATRGSPFYVVEGLRSLDAAGAIAGRIVGLNMYPPSSDAVAGGWNAATAGARLMANALLFAMAPPAFSHAPASTPADACVCTPLLMNEPTYKLFRP